MISIWGHDATRFTWTSQKDHYAPIYYLSSAFMVAPDVKFFFDVLCKLVTMRKLSSDKLFVTFGEIETTVYAIGGQLLGY